LDNIHDSQIVISPDMSHNIITIISTTAELAELPPPTCRQPNSSQHRSTHEQNKIVE
jgi:hypothetical protein